MPDRTEQTAVSVDQKLEATDERGLKDLNKAFDDSFGPRDGASPEARPEPPSPKAPKAKTREADAGAPERAKPGHHAPVEVKRAQKGAEERAEATNFLGEPEYQARRRDRKPIEFDEEIPTADQKSTPFPGRDHKSGKFTKAQTGAPVEAPEEETDEQEPPDEADPEVDSVVVKPNAHPAVKEGFRQLRTIAKTRRAEIKSLLGQSKQLQDELEALRKTGIPPAVREELDRLRATSQRFDLLNDTSFKARYENPIEQAGDRLLNFCVELANGDEGIKKWAQEVKAHGFKNLSTNYWDQEIIPKIASVTNQQRVAQLAADLHSKIDERNRTVTQFTATPDKIQEYNQQKAYEYYSNYANEAQDEANQLITRVGDWAQTRDLSQAQTDEERALFKEHNDRVDGYKTLFEKTMGDVMHGGPRKHVRVVTQAIYGMEADRLLKEKSADFDELLADYESLRSQYNKLTKARSIPGRSGGASDVKPPAGISTRDARSALKEYFGSQGT